MRKRANSGLLGTELTAAIQLGVETAVAATADCSAGCSALFAGFTAVGSEEARSIALALASVRRSNWACSFPAPSFHEDAVRRVASEGIIATKFTSPYSP